MPIVVELEFDNGRKEKHTVPAEIWKKDHKSVSKLFVTNRKVVAIRIDPSEETADSNKGNNIWPPQIEEVPFTLEKPRESWDNEMKRDRAKKAAEAKKKAEEKKKAEAEAKKKAEAKK